MNRKGFTLIELLIVIAIIAILALIAIPNFIEAQTRAKVSRVHADMRSIATALEAYFVDNNAYPIVMPFANITNDGSRYQYYEAHLWWEQGNTAYRYKRTCMLTTPIAYFTGRPPADPFIGRRTLDAPDAYGTKIDHSYVMQNYLGASQDAAFLAARYPSGGFKAPTPLKFNGMEGRVIQTHWALVSPGPDFSYVVGIPWYPWSNKEVHCGKVINGPTSDYTKATQYGGLAEYDPTNGTVSAGCIWRLNAGDPAG